MNYNIYIWINISKEEIGANIFITHINKSIKHKFPAKNLIFFTKVWAISEAADLIKRFM